MNKRIKNITIGSDPEMFIYDNFMESFVPVCGMIGGTKKNPIAITDNGHSLQEDNVAVEFCIPPCKTKEDFIENINFVKNYIENTILKPRDLSLKCVASARFNPNDLLSEQASVFGCDPDNNAWSLKQNVIDRDNIDKNLRSTGMHIHIGYDNPDEHTNVLLIRALDLFLGVPSVLFDPDTERRKLYGKAGAYRDKPYGVEYRVLSSHFLNNNDLLEFIFDNTLKAIEFVNIGAEVTNPLDVIKAINTSDKKLSLEILDEYNIEINNKIII